MKYFIKIDKIMELPVYKREKEAERVIKAVLGKFDIKWTDYLTHKEIIKIINNGGELKDIEKAVKAAKKFWKIKNYIIIPTIATIVFGSLIALWMIF